MRKTWLVFSLPYWSICTSSCLQDYGAGFLWDFGFQRQLLETEGKPKTQNPKMFGALDLGVWYQALQMCGVLLWLDATSKKVSED